MHSAKNFDIYLNLLIFYSKYSLGHNQGTIGDMVRKIQEIQGSYENKTNQHPIHAMVYVSMHAIHNSASTSHIHGLTPDTEVLFEL